MLASGQFPPAQSKNKNAHSVPLSGAALAIIQEHLLGEKLFPDAGNTDVIGKAVERALPDSAWRTGRCMILGGLPSLGWQSLEYRLSCWRM